MRWRVGGKVKVNVYEGERPVCQCHTAVDAARIVDAVNRMKWRPISELHEDLGQVVVINVADEDVGAEIVHVCDHRFDAALWTHFTRFASLSMDDVMRMRSESTSDVDAATGTADDGVPRETVDAVQKYLGQILPKE